MKRTDFFKCVFASQTLAVLRPYDEYGRELMDISVPQGAKNYKLTERTRTEIFVSSCELHLAGVDTKIAELNVQLRALQATRTDLKETIEKLKCTIS